MVGINVPVVFATYIKYRIQLWLARRRSGGMLTASMQEGMREQYNERVISNIVSMISFGYDVLVVKSLQTMICISAGDRLVLYADMEMVLLSLPLHFVCYFDLFGCNLFL